MTEKEIIETTTWIINFILINNLIIISSMIWKLILIKSNSDKIDKLESQIEELKNGK